MPNSTTMRMTVVWLSALRFSALFTSAISPCATSATIAIVMIGISAMIGLRKMISSRTRISTSVASSTICSALLPDCVLSSCWAAAPVTPSYKPAPLTSGLISARRTLTASPACVPSPFTMVLVMVTYAVWTRPFGDTEPAVTPRMFGMCLSFSVLAIEATFAWSAGVSRAWSARANTMIAAVASIFPACGNAWSCRFCALIDS